VNKNKGLVKEGRRQKQNKERTKGIRPKRSTGEQGRKE
jgi:hypothetical protein